MKSTEQLISLLLTCNFVLGELATAERIDCYSCTNSKSPTCDGNTCQGRFCYKTLSRSADKTLVRGCFRTKPPGFVIGQCVERLPTFPGTNMTEQRCLCAKPLCNGAAVDRPASTSIGIVGPRTLELFIGLGLLHSLAVLSRR